MVRTTPLKQGRCIRRLTGAAGDLDAFSLQLPTDIVDAIRMEISQPCALNMRPQEFVPPGPGATRRRVALPGGMASVGGLDEPQQLADRLDREMLTVQIYEHPHFYFRRSSSACAKNALV